MSTLKTAVLPTGWGGYRKWFPVAPLDQLGSAHSRMAGTSLILSWASALYLGWPWLLALPRNTGRGLRWRCQSCDPFAVPRFRHRWVWRGGDPAGARQPSTDRCPVLTEPYSLPLLLMATKNRLATPKMLTTPRSTGESSRRPGGGARVTPRQGTLARPTVPEPLLDLSASGTPNSGWGRWG